VNITSEIGYRALAYVNAVGRHGYALTRDELHAYINAPQQRSGEPRLAALVMRQIQVSLRASMMAEPGETVAAWLERLGWIHAAEDRLSMTPLGRAVLAALEEDERLSDDLPPELVLAPDDPVVYARVIGVISSAGPAALVDPYFDLERLLDIVHRTSVSRILTGPDKAGRGRLPALEQAFNSLTGARSLELRVSDDFHDRLLIADDGRVWSIGTSLNGVGKRLAVLSAFGQGATTDAIRERFEASWNAADPVALIGAPAQLETDAEPDAVVPGS
jgi:hypothetical protein